MYLVHKDIDPLIARKVITSGKIKYGRYLNMIMILFKKYKVFLKACHEKYFYMLKKYYHLEGPLIGSKYLNINKGNYWNKVLKQFSTEIEIVFNNGENGDVRKKLYMLGLISGYSYTIVGQKRREKHSNKGRLLYYEDRVSKLPDNITKKEIKKYKVDWNDWEDFWEESGVNNFGEILYVKKEWLGNKRGVMQNSPGIITFTKRNYLT
jgi:hypothetical protein